MENWLCGRSNCIVVGRQNYSFSLYLSLLIAFCGEPLETMPLPINMFFRNCMILPLWWLGIKRDKNKFSLVGEYNRRWLGPAAQCANVLVGSRTVTAGGATLCGKCWLYGGLWFSFHSPISRFWIRDKYWKLENRQPSMQRKSLELVHIWNIVQRFQYRRYNHAFIGKIDEKVIQETNRFRIQFGDWIPWRGESQYLNQFAFDKLPFVNATNHPHCIECWVCAVVRTFECWVRRVCLYRRFWIDKNIHWFILSVQLVLCF